ncbi:MAG: hypothetical protein JNK82_11255 [Myxococcaceae bacterium]|nr:hypothetical protein [Myxococcaceae bacterium]
MRVQHWPRDLLREYDIHVTPASVTVGGREHVVAGGATIEAESRDPRTLPPLALLCLALLSIPFTLSVREGWVIAVPIVLMLLAGARLFTVESQFCVVLYSAQRRTTLFESRDERLVIALTAAVRAALEER